MRIANCLNSIAYNYPENEPPRVDRTAFKMRSQEQESGNQARNQDKGLNFLLLLLTS